MAGKKSKKAKSSARSAPKADATRKNLRLAKLERSGVANDGRLLFLDIVDDTGAEYRISYPYQAAGALIAELLAAARQGHDLRAASNPVADPSDGSSGSWLLKPQRVAIALTPDRSTVVLRFHIAEGAQIEVGISQEDLPKLREALDVTTKRLAEGAARRSPVSAPL